MIILIYGSLWGKRPNATSVSSNIQISIVRLKQAHMSVLEGV